MTPFSNEVTATVVAVHGRQTLLETDTGQLMPGFARHHRLKAVCGDRARCVLDAGQAVICEIAPRAKTLSRHRGQTGKHLLAANVDTLAVVAAPQPVVTNEQIDRYLAIAELQGLDAIVIQNKCDIGAETLDFETFSALGYSCLRTSATSKQGIDLLARLLSERSSVLVGLSGVGKSSLTNALIPDLATRTAALSTASGGGRHTTTTARLYRLPNGGAIIDSPGVRDIRLWPMPASELARGFREFDPYLGLCRFRDCQHRHEPGCVLKQAVDNKRISQRRYASFRTLSARLEQVSP